jgi:hypothetical protein
MNWLQWLIVLAPMLPLYLFWISSAESQGQRRRWANVWSGLFAVPFFYCFLPLLLLAVAQGELRQGKWRIGILVATIGLGFFVGLGVACYLVRDRPAVVLEVEPRVERTVQPR